MCTDVRYIILIKLCDRTNFPALTSLVPSHSNMEKLLQKYDIIQVRYFPEISRQTTPAVAWSVCLVPHALQTSAEFRIMTGGGGANRKTQLRRHYSRIKILHQRKTASRSVSCLYLLAAQPSHRGSWNSYGLQTKCHTSTFTKGSLDLLFSHVDSRALRQ